MIKISEIMKKAYENWADKEYIYEKKNGIYEAITYGDFIEKTYAIAYELIEKGLKNKKIIVFGPNSTNYMITDVAVYMLVGTSVNINCQTKKEEMISIINKLDIDAIIYDERQKVLFDKIKQEIQTKIVYIGMQTLIENANKDVKLFNIEDKEENGCVKIIYSSGTTSEPKGIMLSLKNIFAGWIPLQKRTPFTKEDIIYLFLPLHHTYANIYNFTYSLLSGLSIYLSSGLENIRQELKEVNPTIFCAVPLIYKKIFEENRAELDKEFGNRIKYLYCGGTKFEEKIRKAYKESGLPMYEAYALTETASSFSIEYANSNDYESVGTIFENIDVKVIDKNKEGVGEITVKGDNVFLGYANNEELTKSVFTKDGYFLTGDYGYIKDDKLYIMGRKSDKLVGENGENVYPKEIEKLLKEYSSDIVKLQAYLKADKINYKIFIREDSKIDIYNIIEEYNKNVTKKDYIKLYEIIYTKETNLKG